MNSFKQLEEQKQRDVMDLINTDMNADMIQKIDEIIANTPENRVVQKGEDCIADFDGKNRLPFNDPRKDTKTRVSLTDEEVKQQDEAFKAFKIRQGFKPE